MDRMPFCSSSRRSDVTSSRVHRAGSLGFPHLSPQNLGKLYLTQRDRCVQGAQYKLFAKTGLILEQVASKLGHKPEATGIAGETAVAEKAEVAEEESRVVTEEVLLLLLLFALLLPRMALARRPNHSSTTSNWTKTSNRGQFREVMHWPPSMFLFFVPKCGTPEAPSHGTPHRERRRAGEMQHGLYPDDTDPASTLLSLVVH